MKSINYAKAKQKHKWSAVFRYFLFWESNPHMTKNVHITLSLALRLINTQHCLKKLYHKFVHNMIGDRHASTRKREHHFFWETILRKRFFFSHPKTTRGKSIIKIWNSPLLKTILPCYLLPLLDELMLFAVIPS